MSQANTTSRQILLRSSKRELRRSMKYLCRRLVSSHAGSLFGRALPQDGLRFSYFCLIDTRHSEVDLAWACVNLFLPEVKAKVSERPIRVELLQQV